MARKQSEQPPRHQYTPRPPGRPFQLKRELAILFAHRGVRIYAAIIACILVTLFTVAAGQLANLLKTSLIEDLAKYQIPFTGTAAPITDLPLYNPSNLDPKIYSTAYLGNYMSFNGKELITSMEGQGSHPGVDIVVPTGTPVRAVADGLVVIASERNNGFGRQVVIGHPNVPDPSSSGQLTNLLSAYAHLDEILTTEGAVVKKGELIGKVGQTGTATTPHLHFQIDRGSAFFHPYWPFTYSETVAAGVSFTQAVSIGLGRERAQQYTVNPLLYAQAYTNFVPAVISGVQLTTATTTNQFVDFKLANPSSLVVKQPTQLTLMAIGLDGQVLNSFSPTEDVRVIVPSERALEGTIILAPTQWQQGQTTFSLTPLDQGDLSLTVRYGSLRTILMPLAVNDQTAAPLQPTLAQSPIVSPNTDQAIPPAPATTTIPPIPSTTVTLLPPAAPTKTTLDHGPWQLFNLDYLAPVIQGHTSRLAINTQDERSTINHQYAPTSTIKIAATDPLAALIGPRELTAVDFVNGQAFTNITPARSGPITVRITDGDSAYLFNLTAYHPQELEPAKLVIEHSGQAKTGETTAITFRVLNNFNTLVPTYTPTDFTLSTTDPNGLFHSQTLTAVDFDEGVALANYIPTIPGDTVIRASDGTLSAVSDVLRVSGEPLVSIANQTIAAPATPAANLAADFPDVTLAHPNAVAIYELKKRGIIKGYEDGTFQPDRPVARVEILKVLLTGFGKSIDQNVASVDFPDIPANTWYPPFIATGKQLGIVKGYDNGTFQPQKTVSRIEAIKMLFATQGIEPATTVSNQPYSDVPLGNWYTGYVAKASVMNLADPFVGNLFHPNEGMTRGEVAELIYRLIYVQDKGIASYPKT